MHAKIKVTLDEVDRDKVIFRKGDGGTEVNKDGENVCSSSTRIQFI